MWSYLFRHKRPAPAGIGPVDKSAIKASIEDHELERRGDKAVVTLYLDPLTLPKRLLTETGAPKLLTALLDMVKEHLETNIRTSHSVSLQGDGRTLKAELSFHSKHQFDLSKALLKLEAAIDADFQSYLEGEKEASGPFIEQLMRKIATDFKVDELRTADNSEELDRTLRLIRCNATDLFSHQWQKKQGSTYQPYPEVFQKDLATNLQKLQKIVGKEAASHQDNLYLEKIWDMYNQAIPSASPSLPQH